MKKTVLLLALALAGAQVVSAQRVEIDGVSSREMYNHEQRSLVNTGYTNLSFVVQKMVDPLTGVKSETSDWGAAIAKGRTFVLHRRPIARMIYFGLDANWVDLNYAHYNMSVSGRTKSQILQADISVLGLGPSVHVMPVEKLGIHAYFRVLPTYGAYANRVGGEFLYVMGGLYPAFTTGGAVSWGAISLGAEARWGTADYEQLTDDEDFNVLEGKLKTSGLRAYVSLRF